MTVRISIAATICICLLIFLVGQQEAQSQQEKPVSLNDIQAELTFTSRISKSEDEINNLLIKDIRKRGVNFILTSEDAKILKKAGANNLLIKVIRENLPKELEEQIILYKKYTDNYNGTVEQKKIAIEAAREFVRKYSGNKEAKEIIDYFRQIVPLLEKQLTHAGDID